MVLQLDPNQLTDCSILRPGLLELTQFFQESITALHLVLGFGILERVQ